MVKSALIDPLLVKNSAELLSILSRKDNLSILMLTANHNNNNEGLEAKSSSIKRIGISKKVYYTRLKQLINAGLVEKSDGIYKHTTLGNMIYQNHILNLIEELKNIKQMKMVDTLKHTKQFSEDEIDNFIRRITGNKISIPDSNTSSIRIEFAWTYQDMVSAMVERIEFCKNEILLASRYLNEIIINSILRKANSSAIKVKVLTDSSLVKQYFEAEGKTLKLRESDKNSSERMNVVSNPWYPDKVSRRIANIPFSMIILDDKEVGIEIVNWNDPKDFYGVIFIKGDEKTLKTMHDLYYGIRANASFTSSSTHNAEEVLNHTSYGRRVQKGKQ